MARTRCVRVESRCDGPMWVPRVRQESAPVPPPISVWAGSIAPHSQGKGEYLWFGEKHNLP